MTFKMRPSPNRLIKTEFPSYIKLRACNVCIGICQYCGITKYTLKLTKKMLGEEKVLLTIFLRPSYLKGPCF